MKSEQTTKTEQTTENLMRRGALGILRVFAGRRQGMPPMEPERIHRVLLIRHDRIGDAVITTPLLSAIKYLAPHAEIDILASPANSIIFRHDSRVHRVFVWGRSLFARLKVIRECRERKYDLVFQLILNRTTLPALLAGLLGPGGRTVGKSMPGHDFLFDHTVQVPEVHFSERTLMLVHGGIRMESPLPAFPYSLEIPSDSRSRAGLALQEAGLAAGGFIVLNISAGTHTRELSDDENTTLARGLARLGREVAIIGGPEAAERTKVIAANSGGRALRFGSILDAAAGLEKAAMVVTPDTGTLHIAVAMGVPVVAMFSATGHPAGWAPLNVPHRVVRAADGDTLSRIDLEEVIGAAAALVREFTIYD